MATTKFEVGKVYITMADKFGDGEQTGKSVVIERTEGTVTFKHLASGEIFVREVEVFDAAEVESAQATEIYTVSRTGKYGGRSNFEYSSYEEAMNSAKNDIEDGRFVSVEIYKNHDYNKACFEWNTDDAKANAKTTVEVEKAKVEVCKAYDAKDIIAACYPVEIAERKVISKSKVDFFRGRLEKISNGQRDFWKDTQRQAVEILGKEIPPEIYNAVNPDKPFMCWLGNKVNPVIEYDDGAKLEIRVNDFGGYSFEDIAPDDLAEIEPCIDDYIVNIDAAVAVEETAVMLELEREIYNKRLKIIQEQAELAQLEEKLVALKISKVAA